MKKFEVGDKVVVKEDIKTRSGKVIIKRSAEGCIRQVRNPYEKYDYEVIFENDNTWLVYEHELELVEDSEKPSGKIKSNGLSSSYYDLPISDKLLEALNKRKKYDGDCFVRTEELIDELFGNDFDFGTLFKSMVRGYLQTKGEGKAGNDLEYEINKVIYYANKIKEKGCE